MTSVSTAAMKVPARAESATASQNVTSPSAAAAETGTQRNQAARPTPRVNMDVTMARRPLDLAGRVVANTSPPMSPNRKPGSRWRNRDASTKPAVNTSAPGRRLICPRSLWLRRMYKMPGRPKHTNTTAKLVASPTMRATVVMLGPKPGSRNAPAIPPTRRNPTRAEARKARLRSEIGFTALGARPNQLRISS